MPLPASATHTTLADLSIDEPVDEQLGTDLEAEAVSSPDRLSLRAVVTAGLALVHDAPTPSGIGLDVDVDLEGVLQSGLDSLEHGDFPMSHTLIYANRLVVNSVPYNGTLAPPHWALARQVGKEPTARAALTAFEAAFMPLGGRYIADHRLNRPQRTGDECALAPGRLEGPSVNRLEDGAWLLDAGAHLRIGRDRFSVTGAPPAYSTVRAITPTQHPGWSASQPVSS